MPARASARAAVLSVPFALLAVACSSGDVKQTVDVTVSDDACQLSSTTLEPGRTAFDVKNDSGREAEAYVYTSDGDKVDEVEGIADGTSRTLTVSVESGSYEFACKPEGKDVRTPFTVE